MTTKVTSSVLANTAVVAGNYGGATVQTVIAVDAQGRITSASNVTSTVANTQITGLITAPQIASVANTQITGLITSGQIATVANTKITGLITAPQIGSVSNTAITGVITAPQIAPSAIPAGGFTNIFSSTTPGPASWPAPPSTTKIKVTVVGGGGGAPAAGGGGGGGTAIKIIPVTGGTSYPYTVGAAGANPGTGGTTSFGSPASVSATGGSGPGTGGAGSSGDINLTGGGGGSVPVAVSGSVQDGCGFPFGSWSGSAGPAARGGGSSLLSGGVASGAGNPFGGGGAGGVGGVGGIIIEY